MTNLAPETDIEFTDRESRKPLLRLRTDRDTGHTMTTVLGIDRNNKVATLSALCIAGQLYELRNPKVTS